MGVVPLEDCFFTNVYMGLSTVGESNTGQSPGATDSDFTQSCEAFLEEQIAVQKPRVVLALGRFVPRFIASLSRDLAGWKKWRGFKALDASGPLKEGVHFGDHLATVVVLTHPSLRGSNVERRRYRGLEGHAAEGKMLEDALSGLRTQTA